MGIIGTPTDVCAVNAHSIEGLRRLAIVCFEDPRHVTGGVQRRVAAEVTYFAERGVGVTVICAGTGERKVEGNVCYVTVQTPTLIYPLRTLIFSARAASLLRSMPPFDIVETHHDAGAAGLMAFRSRGMKDAAFVEVVHGVFRDEFASVRHYEGLLSRGTLAASGLLALSLVERLASRRADAVVTVSKYSAGKVMRHYGVRRERIHILPNGIDTARYSPASLPRRGGQYAGECEVVFVGRWHSRKGVPQLLRAFSIAHTIVPGLRLTLIGAGPLEAALREEAVELGIREWVSFKSGLSDAEIVAAYQGAGIVCVPSLQEGQGIVALEAQACGAPVVVTRAGGLAETVVEGRTGTVIEPGDVAALGRALAEMALSDEMRREYGANAAEWAVRFADPNMLAKAATLYSHLVVSKKEASTGARKVVRQPSEKSRCL